MLQGYKVTGLQGYRVAGLQGYRVTGLQSFDVRTFGLDEMFHSVCERAIESPPIFDEQSRTHRQTRYHQCNQDLAHYTTVNGPRRRIPWRYTGTSRTPCFHHAQSPRQYLTARTQLPAGFGLSIRSLWRTLPAVSKHISSRQALDQAATQQCPQSS